MSSTTTATDTPASPLSRVAVALDTPQREDFRRWARFFGPRVGVLKVGLEAFVSWGRGAVEEAAEHGAVFLDLTLHDIPTTVAGAVPAQPQILAAGAFAAKAGCRDARALTTILAGVTARAAEFEVLCRGGQ